MVKFKNFHRSNNNRKWIEVVVFDKQPDDSPRTSKECVDLAKFTHKTDAVRYAESIVESINSDPSSAARNAWAIVVR